MTGLVNAMAKESEPAIKDNTQPKDQKGTSQKKFQIFLEIAQGFSIYEIGAICSLHRAVKNGNGSITMSETETQNLNRYLNLGLGKGNGATKEQIVDFRLNRVCELLKTLPNFIGVERIGDVANFLIKVANDKKAIDECANRLPNKAEY